MNIEEMIKNEEISLTDKISIDRDNRDYYVFWRMEGRKTIWGEGIILLVDNDWADYSFKEAFSKKYDIDIFNTTKYDNLINDKIKKARKGEE